MNHISPQEVGLAREPAGGDRIEFLQARLAMYPDRIGLRLRLARLLEENGHVRDAEDLLRETAARAPDNPRARADLDDFLERSAKLDSAAAPASEPVQAAPAAEDPEVTDARPHRPDVADAARVPPAGLASLADPPARRPPVALAPLWLDSEAGRAVARSPIGIPIAPARTAWRPPIELVGSICIVAVVAALGMFSRQLPHGAIMRPAPDLRLLPDSTAPSIGTPGPDTIATLPPARLPTALPQVQTAVLETTLPTVLVAAQARAPATPDDPPLATPLNVVVLYAGHGDRGVKTAEDVAARLRLGGMQASPAALRGHKAASAGIGYYFDEDRQAALALAGQLGGGFGPVHLLARSKANPPAPGSVTLVLP